MRSTTLLAHLWRVSILAVALLALPQLASAQLPLETKSLKIQATTGTDAVTMTASTVSAPYTLNFPAAIGTPGGMLYVRTSATGTAQLAFATATGIANGWSPIWDGTDIVWVDPNSATNPNWSRAGNAISTEGLLGTTTAGGSIKVITGASQERMLIGATGAISINTNATEGGATTTIGRAAGHTTVVDGTFDVNGATTIDGATIGITGATTIVGAVTVNNNENNAVTINGGTSTGAVTIGGTGAQTVDIATGAAAKTVSIGSTNTTSATNINAGSGEINITGNIDVAAGGLLKFADAPGTSGDVLVSQGTTSSPQWQNLNQALGIRDAGKVSVTNATSVTVTGVTGLTAPDAIILTIEGASGVAASVFSRDVVAGSFVVRFSGEYNGELNYLVIKPY
jgi:hypothetical protein